ncbi:hypothetical protein B0H12DRAFT_236108 [Mycena haematopus]|nr:hypothetical protein B0H12DRAFT_236108 [Mycena haematopus]
MIPLAVRAKCTARMYEAAHCSLGSPLDSERHKSESTRSSTNIPHQRHYTRNMRWIFHWTDANSINNGSAVQIFPLCCYLNLSKAIILLVQWISGARNSRILACNNVFCFVMSLSLPILRRGRDCLFSCGKSRRSRALAHNI